MPQFRVTGTVGGRVAHPFDVIVTAPSAGAARLAAQETVVLDRDDPDLQILEIEVDPAQVDHLRPEAGTPAGTSHA